MRLYSLAYACMLRWLVELYPILWGENCRWSEWEFQRRRLVRGSGRM